MPEAKFTIKLDFQGKSDLEKIIAEIGRQHNIPVNVDLSQAKLGIFKNLEAPLKSAYESLRLFATQTGLAISGFREIGAMFNSTFGEIIKAAADAEASGIRLQGALRATGMEVEDNSARLARFASSLQKVTVYEDDMLKSSMAQLQNIARFGDVSSLEKATKASIGLANAFGIDLQTAMDLVGKAAAGNTSMLGRYGIVLDETASQAEKFAQVLQIGMGYFPLAEEYAKSQMGSMEQLKNTWGDFLETLGEGVLPAIQNLTNTLKPLIEAATAMSGEQKTMTIGLIVLNALWIKSALAIASNRIAFSALTIEQQKQVASLIMIAAVQKGAVLTSITFSGAMKAIGAAFVAAGNGVKAFLASIGTVGWIIIGITAAYAGLNAIFKKNTEAMKDNISEKKKAIEQDNQEIEKKKGVANETIKLTQRYEELAVKAKTSKKEQEELSRINTNLKERYPALISSTGTYASRLEGVRAAASKAKGELSSLGRQMWKNNLEMQRYDIQNSGIEAFEALKEFTWMDVSFTGARSTALHAIGAYKDELLNIGSMSITTMKNMANGFDSLANQSEHFTQKEEASLRRAANILRSAAIQKENLSRMEKEGYKEEVSSPSSSGERGGGADDTKTEREQLIKEAQDAVAEYQKLKDAKFDLQQSEITAVKKKYEEMRKIFSADAPIQTTLIEMEGREIAEIKARYNKEEEDRVAEHYEQVKFYDSAYYSWKKKQIKDQAETMFASEEEREAWISAQMASLDGEKAEWERRPLAQFEADYESEMSHLAELRELGLATWGEIAEKSKEYYDKLTEIVNADDTLTEAEKELLSVYLKRYQAAQLAVNKESPEVGYYDEMKFQLDDYYDWKKKRIEEDVKAMDLSEEQKAELLKKRLGELDSEQHQDNQDRSLIGFMLDDLGVSESDQKGIIESYSILAGQISSIWKQLYSNLESARQDSLEKLEKRAKDERRTEAWLASEKAKINADYDKKARQLKKAEKAMQIASASMNTAEAVTNALTLKPAWLAPIMAAAVGALGLYQVSLIANQKLARGGMVNPGIFRGKGTSTSDSNLVAISDNEYIVSARRVRELGLPLFDALNFGNTDAVRSALAGLSYRLNRQEMTAVTSPVSRSMGFSSGGYISAGQNDSSRVQKVVLVCDGRELARAVAKGNKRILST